MLAEDRGRTVMFWDDMIVRKHPELIPELPKNAIAIEWGYELKKGIDAAIFDRDCRNLKENGYRVQLRVSSAADARGRTPRVAEGP